MFWPSTYPASRSAWMNAVAFSFWAAWRKPILGTFAACCASAGNDATRPPRKTATRSAMREAFISRALRILDGERREHAVRCSAMGSGPSLNHLVRSNQQRLWDRKPERPRCFQIDDQLEARRLLDGKVGR